MRIYAANSVFIEVTRRCNMCCAHCLRGDAESIDIQEKYIDAFLDNFEKGAYISSLTFTGGEISLNIPAIRYTLKAVKERGIAVGSFYMVTNGKAIDKMADLAMASLEWWTYCDEKDDDMCSLCISSDNFHEAIPYESKSILSGLKYNRNDKVTDFHRAYLLNEGRAKNLDSNVYKKREPYVDKLEYEFNKTGNIDFYSGFMYRILGLPDQLFTPMFAVARMVGWSAHRLEELMNCDKIIRPAYQSVAMDKEYVPMKDRIIVE